MALTFFCCNLFREVDFCKMEHLSDWFLKINSAGTIPVLVDDGLTICDR